MFIAQGIIGAVLILGRNDSVDKVNKSQLKPNNLDIMRGIESQRLDKNTYVPPTILTTDETIKNTSSVSLEKSTNEFEAISKAIMEAKAMETKATETAQRTYYTYFIQLIYGVPVETKANDVKSVESVAK